MAMDKVKFRKPVVPGDQITFELTMIRQKSRVCKMKGLATVGDALVAEAELMASIMEQRAQDIGKTEVIL
jgi:3-hydroxymyristoyl/3-hydroxydecanoyl-(acyl carrier protein) dehydratase